MEDATAVLSCAALGEALCTTHHIHCRIDFTGWDDDSVGLHGGAYLVCGTRKRSYLAGTRLAPAYVIELAEPGNSA